MDWHAIRRRRRRLLVVAGVLVTAALVVGLLFGRRWRQEVILQALASPDEAKASWAKRQLGKAPDQGVGLLLEHLSDRGELFDLRVADHLEELGRGPLLPVELRVRAAVAHLSDPVLASVGMARLMELPPEALPELLRQSRQLTGLELHRAARAACKLDRERSADQARQLLQDASPEAKRLGAAILGVIGERSSTKLLLPLLAHPDESVRAEAVGDLVLVQGASALGQLRPLLEDPDEAVRQAVLQAVAQVGSAEHGDLVASALDDRAESVRAEAILALAELQAHEHAEELPQLADDSSPAVRRAVALALTELKPRGEQQLLQKLSRDRSPEVRLATVPALGVRNGKAWAISQLIRLAEDDSLKVVRAAYRALVDSRRTEVIPFFIGQLTNDRPSWATDPLPAQVAGTRPQPVPLGAMAACALRWLTGREFGYHWRASTEERRTTQERWAHWWSGKEAGFDPSGVTPPDGLSSYEQLLRHMSWPP